MGILTESCALLFGQNAGAAAHLGRKASGLVANRRWPARIELPWRGPRRATDRAARAVHHPGF